MNENILNEARDQSMQYLTERKKRQEEGDKINEIDISMRESPFNHGDETPYDSFLFTKEDC